MSEASVPAGVRMRRRRFGLAGWFAALLALFCILIAVAVVIWWGPLREYAMDPSVPFETYTPPPAPDYSKPEAWALPIVQSAAGPADIFFVHPTTYSGRTWNAPTDAPRAARLLKEAMIPNYAGPFQRLGRVFVPHYRQASLYTTLTLREDAREARAFAYQDVRAAFDHYLSSLDQGRPLIIAGVDQGAVLADRLAREAAEDPAIKARLAAVYLIDAAIPADAHTSAALLPACVSRTQTGCVAAYLAEPYNDAGRTRDRLRHAPVWKGGELVSLAKRKPLCFNPLIGAASPARADPQDNLGAANATGLEWGDRPGFLQHQVGAQCVDGVLKITKPRSPALRPGLSWTERQQARPFNIFYADLEADAQGRVAALAGP